MKRFLVPVDFSNCSKIALDYAVRLAGVVEANITIIHAFSSGNGKQELLGKWAEKSSVYLKKSNLDLSVDFVSLKGKHAEVIVDYVNNSTLELVVMGAKGGGRLRQIIGSLSYPVLDNTNIPVLFIPEIDQIPIPKNVFYASDFKDADVDCLKKFYRLFSELDMVIDLTHFSRDEDLDTDKKMLDVIAESVQESFPYLKIESYVFQKKENLSVLDMIYAQNTDWIVMSTHPRDFMGKIINPSLSRRLIQQIAKPILLFKDRE